MVTPKRVPSVGRDRLRLGAAVGVVSIPDTGEPIDLPAYTLRSLRSVAPPTLALSLRSLAAIPVLPFLCLLRLFAAIPLL